MWFKNVCLSNIFDTALNHLDTLLLVRTIFRVQGFNSIQSFVQVFYMERCKLKRMRRLSKSIRKSEIVMLAVVKYVPLKVYSGICICVVR